MSAGRYGILIIPILMLLCGCGAQPNERKGLPSEDLSSGRQMTAAPERSGVSGTAPDFQDTPLSEGHEPILAQNAPQVSSEPALAPQSGLPQAGVRSLENLIFTALEPVGSTMYVWGGGWNEEDTGAGQEALSVGCSGRWAEFAAKQDESYDYRNHRYLIHDGLDCSGYVGWVLYNVFYGETAESEQEGYVMKAALMAEIFACFGWGELISGTETAEWKPGDVCSMSGHVWLSLGMCRDGSVLLLHASPPGVRLCGTLSEDGERTEAVALAEEWMSACYPEWYAKFPQCSVGAFYLTDSKVMRWNSDTLADAGRFQEFSAEEIADYFR